MKYRSKQLFLFLVCVLLALGTGSAGRAQLALTPDGVAEGLTLTTFADRFPHAGALGPSGIEVLPDGSVLVARFSDVRQFPTDLDGQHAPDYAPFFSSGFDMANDLVHIGDTIYMTQAAAGRLVTLDLNGTVQTVVAGLGFPEGIAINPRNNHLFVGSLSGSGLIWEVDPIAGTKTLFVAGGQGVDGMTTDGEILYAARRDRVLGYRISDKALMFDTGFLADVPDGITLGYGKLAGKLFINTNRGTVIEVNLTTLERKVIANGGSRGDFIDADPNCSLLLTQTDRVMRLTPPPDSCFGTPPPPAPEPGPLSLLAAVVTGGLAAIRRRR